MTDLSRRALFALAGSAALVPPAATVQPLTVVSRSGPVLTPGTGAQRTWIFNGATWDRVQ